MPEILIASTVLLLVLGGAFLTFGMYQRTWRTSEVWMEADREANVVMHRMVYGIGDQRGLRAATAATINVATNANGWSVAYVTSGSQTNQMVYERNQGHILFLPEGRRVGQNITQANLVLHTNTLGIVKTGYFSLAVDRQAGQFRASRELDTEVRFRN